jgi:hypothetical protein
MVSIQRGRKNHKSRRSKNGKTRNPPLVKTLINQRISEKHLRLLQDKTRLLLWDKIGFSSMELARPIQYHENKDGTKVIKVKA